MFAPHEFPIAVTPLSEDDGGGFIAYALDLYGCFAEGETPSEAVSNLQDAIGEWIDEAGRLERPVPSPGTVAKESDTAWKSLVDLVSKQDDLLKEQERMLNEQNRAIHLRQNEIEAQIEELRKVVSAILPLSEQEHEHSLPPPKALWRVARYSIRATAPVRVIDGSYGH